ncbi:hypothetical protein Tco_0896311 [Tanacetum coccineum]
MPQKPLLCYARSLTPALGSQSLHQTHSSQPKSLFSGRGSPQSDHHDEPISQRAHPPGGAAVAKVLGMTTSGGGGSTAGGGEGDLGLLRDDDGKSDGDDDGMSDGSSG